MAEIRDEPLRRTPHNIRRNPRSLRWGYKMGSPARVRQPPSGCGSRASYVRLKRGVYCGHREQNTEALWHAATRSASSLKTSFPSLPARRRPPFLSDALTSMAEHTPQGLLPVPRHQSPSTSGRITISGMGSKPPRYSRCLLSSSIRKYLDTTSVITTRWDPRTAACALYRQRVGEPRVSRRVPKPQAQHVQGVDSDRGHAQTPPINRFSATPGQEQQAELALV